MSTPPSLPAPEPPTPQATEDLSYPAIAFQIAGHWLALPQAALLRVVPQSTLNQTVQSTTLAYLGNQPVAMLHLEAVLATVQGYDQSAPHSSEPPSIPPFVVIAALETTLVGIPIQQLPILLNLPLAATHALPANYYSAIQGIASHGINVPKLGVVLLLNLHAALFRSV